MVNAIEYFQLLTFSKRFLFIISCLVLYLLTIINHVVEAVRLIWNSFRWSLIKIDGDNDDMIKSGLSSYTSSISALIQSEMWFPFLSIATSLLFWNATLVYKSAADYNSVERNTILQESSRRILEKNPKESLKNFKQHDK